LENEIAHQKDRLIEEIDEKHEAKQVIAKLEKELAEQTSEDGSVATGAEVDKEDVSQNPAELSKVDVSQSAFWRRRRRNRRRRDRRRRDRRRRTRRRRTPSPTTSPTPSPTSEPTEAPTQFPTQSPTQSPTRDPTHAVGCGSWCEPSSRAWATKCEFNACIACANCADNTGQLKPGGQFCESWCKHSTEPWTTKCNFERACADCTGC
jgi:hypothetical protein